MKSKKGDILPFHLMHVIHMHITFVLDKKKTFMNLHLAVFWVSSVFSFGKTIHEYSRFARGWEEVIIREAGVLSILVPGAVQVFSRRLAGV